LNACASFEGGQTSVGKKWPRREDALDTVIALRRPEDYAPNEGARFEVHFEKLRDRIEGDAAASFEARLESNLGRDSEQVCWSARPLKPPLMKQAAGLFENGMSVREVAAELRISKTEAGRLRLKLVADGVPMSQDRETCGVTLEA